MTLSQNDSGRAFEYGLASSLSRHLPAPLRASPTLLTAQRCYRACSVNEQQHINAAADEAALFLIAHDKRLSEKGCSVYLQSDQLGKQGDVRDIVVHNSALNADVGISAKNRHFAVKHSRLSGRIDFGADWLGVPCSADYFNRVSPIFDELRRRKEQGERWSGILDKKQRYYMPIIQAFQTEMQHLFAREPQIVPKALVKYLLGRFDYYKVIKENGTVSVTSFNIDGTLLWGTRLRMPTRIVEISLKPDSQTTLMMYFDQGWQVSFRIHNASSRVEPSLKFDINLIGLPQATSRQFIEYRGPNVTYVGVTAVPKHEPYREDLSRVRSEEEAEGLLRCVRCDHIERMHSEAEDEEDGDTVYCHVPGCYCDGFVSPYGIA
ncbi:MAG TPA: HaeIII family restriction endonuclease [Pyrinomonadaceae bacterium]|jgi:hypothetical protein